MTPQKQLFLHNPPHTYGDCYRTALACLLDCPVERVPHFAEKFWDNVSGWNKAVDDWLMEHFKLRQFHIVYNTDLQQTLESVDLMNPEAIFLLAGISKNGTAHEVIAGHSRILWDPSRDNSSIVAPIDGLYWVTLLVPHYHYAPFHDEQAPISEEAWNSTRPVPGGNNESQ